MNLLPAYNKTTHKLSGKAIARLVSDLINPLFLPPIVIGLSSWMLGLPSLTLIIGLCLLLYTLIPVSATFYLLKKNHITSVDLPERRSRGRLFLFSIACAAVAFLCLRFIPVFAHPLPGTLALVFLLNPSIGFLINLKWKMSIHTAALSTAGAVFFAFSYLGISTSVIWGDVLPGFVLLILIPLVVWARYRLNIHSLSELLGGAFAGFLLTVIELSLLINWW
ncbi:MAG TPA: hypothetical protein VFG39_09190 [Balneolaceae bacterium]|nr:hypothetical protein [Balneolaceae bacterium]